MTRHRPFPHHSRTLTSLAASLITIATHAALIVNGDEVFDDATNLTWRRCAEGQTVINGACTGTTKKFTHVAALAQASSEAASTGKAWRLPNMSELESIVDRSRSNPAIDPVAFPSTSSTYFWSSSPVAGYATSAWFVDFSNGLVYGSLRYSSDAVRLAR
jgi:hypothetical protein